MSLNTTIGQLLVNNALPEEMQDYTSVWTKPVVKAKLEVLAKTHPELYKDTLKHLFDIGREISYSGGSHSFSIDDLAPPECALAARKRLHEKVQGILTNQKLSSDDKNTQIIEATSEENDRLMKEVLAEATAKGNPLAEQVNSGARGNALQLKRLIAGDMLYTDHRGRVIPIPITKSYSEGLTPGQFFAATFAARKGLVDTKLCLGIGTLVRMADGTDKPIEELVVGDWIVGVNRFCRTHPTQVTAVFQNGLRFCYRFLMKRHKDGRKVELVATGEHKVLGREFTVGGEPSREKQIYTLQEMANETKKLKLVGRPKGVDYYTIVEQQEIGAFPTFDIEVQNNDHLFLLSTGLVVSNSTQKAGFLNKQMNQVTHRLMTTAIDDDEFEHDPNSPRGMPTSVDDKDNEGALLAQDVGGYKRNEVLTPKILKDLKSRGIDRLLVRSPTVGGPEDGGVYSRDVGVREKSGLTPLGDEPGLAAAQALAEPITQAMLGAKHSSRAKTVAGGYPVINQYLQIPKMFKGGATHSQLDGSVEHIREAPAGGWYISVGGQEHYVEPDQEITAKKGQQIEAGDTLSTGLPNPAEIVKHKGIGEGRRYFTDAMLSAYKDGGIYAHRRNVELLSRGMIDHVEFHEETDNHLPGDVVHYHNLERSYEPRDGHDIRTPKQAAGQYLEVPVLHFSIGTKVRPSVIKELENFGIKHVVVHPDEPPFTPKMIRAIDNLSQDPDWLTRFLGSNQKKNLLEQARTGATSDLASSSFVPALVEGLPIGKRWPTMAINADTKNIEPGPVPEPKEEKKPGLMGKIKSIFSGREM